MLQSASNTQEHQCLKHTGWSSCIDALEIHSRWKRSWKKNKTNIIVSSKPCTNSVVHSKSFEWLKLNFVGVFTFKCPRINMNLMHRCINISNLSRMIWMSINCWNIFFFCYIITNFEVWTLGSMLLTIHTPILKHP